MYPYWGNTEIYLYDFLNNISVFALIIFNLSQLRYKKEFLGKISKHIMEKSVQTKKESIFSKNIFWALIETLIVSFFQFAPVMSLNKAFGNLVNTGTNYFGLCFFLPIILITVLGLLTIPPLKQLDLITPAFALTLITIKIGCFCAGCCKGIPCDSGFYNHNTELVEFPVQLVESGLAVLIFIFLMLYRKKAKEGTLFPIYLMVYSGTRFFSEFLRADPDIIWIFKKYHLLCIICFVIGLLELIIVRKYKDRIICFFDKAPEISAKAIRIGVSTAVQKAKENNKIIRKNIKQSKKSRAAKRRAKRGITIVHHKKIKHKKK